MKFLRSNSRHYPLHVVTLPQELVHPDLVYLTDAIHAGLVLAESAELGGDAVKRRAEVHAGVLQRLVLVMRPYVQNGLY